MMLSEQKFDDIRPYRDDEVQAVLKKMVKDEGFIYMLKKVKKEEDILNEFQNFKNIQSIDDFQNQHVSPYVNNIVKLTIKELTYSGLENVEPNKKYLFLGNHRDIILDSALLNNIFKANAMPTTEIGLGDNLLVFDWIKDLVKLNRGIIVKRSLQGREMLQASMNLSEYISRSISENRRSVWLAQRPGRTKDGCDKTHPGLIKMLALNNRKNMIMALNTLNICPVSVSYENEPCEDSKVLASYHAQNNIPYIKTKEEDLKSMGRGLLYKKGRVHIHIAKPVDFSAIKQLDKLTDNEITEKAAQIIDKEIYAGYKFFPKNYIAYDTLQHSEQYLNEGKYTQDEKAAFTSEIKHLATNLKKEHEIVEQIFSKLYAYPLINSVH